MATKHFSLLLILLDYCFFFSIDLSFRTSVCLLSVVGNTKLKILNRKHFKSLSYDVDYLTKLMVT